MFLGNSRRRTNTTVDNKVGALCSNNSDELWRHNMEECLPETIEKEKEAYNSFSRNFLI
jgi:predicted secreted protein